jgi:hypothetical protein
MLQWVVDRVNCPQTSWVTRKKFVKRFTSVTGLLPRLQEPTPLPSLGGALALRFFGLTLSEVAPTRSWHRGGGSQHKLVVLCIVQRLTRVDPASSSCAAQASGVAAASLAVAPRVTATYFRRSYCGFGGE